jgi:hypothetical protein
VNARLKLQANIALAEEGRPTTSTWPGDVPFHACILSAWDEPVLRLQGANSVRRIDLANLPFPENRSLGGPYDTGLTLGRFPHWMDTAKGFLA